MLRARVYRNSYTKLNPKVTKIIMFNLEVHRLSNIELSFFVLLETGSIKNLELMKKLVS